MLDPIPSLAELHRLGAAQQPVYPDADDLARVLSELRRRPPLVFAGECDELRGKVAEVAAGRSFMLQGGDCAETFDSVTAANIRGKLRVLLSMAVVLTYAAQVPVLKVGRIAGQYAKPRSRDLETRGATTLPAYRGDAVNALEFSLTARTPDPQRLIEVYNHSAATLNLLRAFVKGGFADLRAVHSWNSDFVRSSNAEQRYEQLAAEIERALAFMVACGVDNHVVPDRGLLLQSRGTAAGVRARPDPDRFAHRHAVQRQCPLVWIGERTRQLDGAHVEYLRHLRNPIGVKLGPSATPGDTLALLERLDPDQEPGRLTVDHPDGRRHVSGTCCRRSSRPSSDTGRQVAWVCDPMHGNTFESSTGYKTRAFARWPTSCTASSTCTRRWAPGRAGCTSSSPATTSPSAWAGSASWPRPTSPTGTRPPATRG